MEVYSIFFAFTKVSSLDDVFTEVGPSFYWGILSPYEDERICRKYDNCDIPFYKHTFLVVDLRLPFSAFDIEFLKYLAIAPSKLHPVSWAYIKFYQYWCEYLNRKYFVILFFHIFKCHYDSSTQACGRL